MNRHVVPQPGSEPRESEPESTASTPNDLRKETPAQAPAGVKKDGAHDVLVARFNGVTESLGLSGISSAERAQEVAAILNREAERLWDDPTERAAFAGKAEA